MPNHVNGSRIISIIICNLYRKAKLSLITWLHNTFFTPIEKCYDEPKITYRKKVALKYLDYFLYFWLYILYSKYFIFCLDPGCFKRCPTFKKTFTMSLLSVYGKVDIGFFKFSLFVHPPPFPPPPPPTVSVTILLFAAKNLSCLFHIKSQIFWKRLFYFTISSSKRVI